MIILANARKSVILTEEKIKTFRYERVKPKKNQFENLSSRLGDSTVKSSR